MFSPLSENETNCNCLFSFRKCWLQLILFTPIDSRRRETRRENHYFPRYKESLYGERSKKCRDCKLGLELESRLMDTPKSCSPTTNSNAENLPVQASQINLSPIRAEKAPPVAQGFLQLASSPILSKSPKLCPRRKTALSKRELTPGLTTTIIESANQHVRLYTRLNSCNERSSHRHRSEDNQIRGFAQYPDQLLDDVGNTASLDPKFSSDLTVEKFESVDQPPDSLTASTDFVPKSECDFTARACEEIAVTPPAVTAETEEGHKINTSIDVSAIEYEVQQGDDISIDQFPKVDFYFPAAPLNQDQESMIKNKEAGQAHTFYQPYDFLPGYMQIDKENENSLEAAGAVWTGPKELANDPEAFQKPDLPRRSLLFEDSTQSNHPVKRPSNSGAKKSLSLEAPLTPIGSELQENFQQIYPSSLKPTITTAKPSGVGLHLNSIVHAVKARAGAVVNVVKSAQRANNISIQEEEPIPLAHSHLFHSTNNSPLFLPTESVYALGDSNRHRYASSSSSWFMLRPLNNSAMVSTVKDQLPSSGKRKYSCETDSGSEDVKSRSKERKSSSDTNDGNSCQRCNCKKSQCLKLYCDCFAAGIYCAEPCACQGCYNRPEYDDTVNETRMQIQSRNPLAFASKIDEGTQFTPSSARHKRGCNCKRSMCVKKYCECYQAKVGCSDGCRCQGCINTYGQKREYLKDKDFVAEKCIIERTEDAFIETMAESGKDLYRSELANPHNLSPVTPEVQFWKKDSSKGWLHSAECLQGLSYVKSPYVMNTGSPKNLENSGTISQTPHEVQNLLMSDKKLYSDAGGDFSKTSPQFGNAGNLVDKFSSIVEVEIPDILKHSLAPSDAVKVSSPNKKRVSSPQVLQHELGSSSIGGVIGRRLILKSVPSFPPLSPHLDFRNTSPEQGKDPESNKDKI